jgi:serine/threonine protein kinase
MKDSQNTQEITPSSQNTDPAVTSYWRERGNQLVKHELLTEAEESFRKGDFGTVWLYTFAAPPQQVLDAGKNSNHIVVKKLKSDIEPSIKKTAETRFKEEIDIHRAIKPHPNIVAFYDTNVSEGEPWMAMEFCETGDLYWVLSKIFLEGMDERFALFYMLRLTDALAHLHKQHIVHRDLKPQNIFLDNDLEPKLGDFGLAGTYQNEEDKLKDPLGTLNYASPEIPLGRSYDARTDIWSLGIIAFALVEARLPAFDRKKLAKLYLDNRRSLRGIERTEVLGYPLEAEERASLLGATATDKSIYMNHEKAKDTILHNRLHQKPNMLMLFEKCTQIDPEKRPKSRELYQTTKEISDMGEEKIASIKTELKAHFAKVKSK